jgi:endonuclease/exonuclease/phosphatase family metal-dependent hydrolase
LIRNSHKTNGHLIIPEWYFPKLLYVKSIKIVTINTWKCDGNYPVRMLLLAEQLTNLKPDIVACQECFQSDEGNADTLKFLAGELEMEFCFLAGRQRKRLFRKIWVDSFSGLGILSMFPIIGMAQFDLPNSPGDNDRKVQQALIELPTGNLLLTNTHLTHLRDVNLRTNQAKTLAALVTADKSARYHVVCGDFNAKPDSKEIETFKKLSGAIDCYATGNGAEPRYSLEEAFRVNKMICVDYIFAMLIADSNNYPQFTNSCIVLNTEDETTGLYPSDHFGISTTMAIE